MPATRFITAAAHRRGHSGPAAVPAACPSRRVRVMAKIGYARVSTRSQKDDSQIDELTGYGCDKIFTDTASGKLADRPELDKALAYLRAGDVLVITRLSRAMRSLKHLLALADELRERGIDLVVLRQHIDTTTPTGRLVFHVLGDRRIPARADRRGHPRGPRGRRGPRPHRGPQAQAERRQGRHRPAHVRSDRAGWQEAAHRR